MPHENTRGHKVTGVLAGGAGGGLCTLTSSSIPQCGEWYCFLQALGSSGATQWAVSCTEWESTLPLVQLCLPQPHLRFSRAATRLAEMVMGLSPHSCPRLYLSLLSFVWIPSAHSPGFSNLVEATGLITSAWISDVMRCDTCTISCDVMYLYPNWLRGAKATYMCAKPHYLLSCRMQGLVK